MGSALTADDGEGEDDEEKEGNQGHVEVGCCVEVSKEVATTSMGQPHTVTAAQAMTEATAQAMVKPERDQSAELRCAPTAVARGSVGDADRCSHATESSASTTQEQQEQQERGEVQGRKEEQIKEQVQGKGEEEEENDKGKKEAKEKEQVRQQQEDNQQQEEAEMLLASCRSGGGKGSAVCAGTQHGGNVVLPARVSKYWPFVPGIHSNKFRE